MNVAFQTHWLENAIRFTRLTPKIAEAIATHPDFLALITESVAFTQHVNRADDNQTRIIAEHIVSRLY